METIFAIAIVLATSTIFALMAIWLPLIDSPDPLPIQHEEDDRVLDILPVAPANIARPGAKGFGDTTALDRPSHGIRHAA